MQFAVWYTHDVWVQNGEVRAAIPEAPVSFTEQTCKFGVHGISCVHSVPLMPCHAGNVRLQIVAWPWFTAWMESVARPAGGPRDEQNAFCFYLSALR